MLLLLLLLLFVFFFVVVGRLCLRLSVCLSAGRAGQQFEEEYIRKRGEMRFGGWFQRQDCSSIDSRDLCGMIGSDSGRLQRG